MAYAAVISLKHTIERLINPTNPQITKSAYEGLELLEDVLTRLDASNNGNIIRSVINALDAEIRDAVWKLEDVFESYVLYNSLSPSHNHGHDECSPQPQIPPIDEKGVKQEIESFLRTVKKLGEEYTIELEYQLPREEDEAVSPIHDFDGKKSTVVELSDQFGKITDDLLDLHRALKVVSLVGMAGIGKTFVARKIYELPIILSHFNLKAWVNVGPKHQIKKVLVDILAQIEHQPTDLYMEKEMQTLADLLYKCLHGRIYFIVLDDIWSTQVWDYLKMFFPDNGNGSRIILTTRLEKVAHPTTYSVHKMRFLNNEESWDLLWQNVFADKSFPPQLEEAGRKIAENCEGLPLLILVVANILCRLEKTEDYWRKVADKKTTTFTDAYEKISKVLSSSYEYLPQYLKACFLYMGVFPQNSKIPLPKLINLWTVEDFLEPKQSQALEEFAMECLIELVSRSLVIICKQSSNYMIKSSKLHSAYWHLCVKEARKNKYLHVLNKLADVSEDYMESQRRLSIQNNILFGIKQVCDSMADILTAHSLLCTGRDHKYPVPICSNLVFLKVLDALTIRFYEFPGEVLKLLQLRYFALTLDGKLPCLISKLRNLQSFIVRQYHNIKSLGDTNCLPKEIWDLQELRHLRIMGSTLPDPSDGAELPNLSTLHVNADSCTKDVFRSIPKLKKLGIKIELQPDVAETLSCFEHIFILHELDSLKCVVANPHLGSQVVAPPHHLSNLPSGLKKLSLNGLGYPWEYMSAIGSLPSLQVLKLRCCAFEGSEWETEASEFPSLEFLLLEDNDLEHLATEDEKCFPSLQRLIISHCYNLNEIPPQMGSIPTLKSIEVVECGPSVMASAQQIQDREMYFGNFSLEVLITSKWKNMRNPKQKFAAENSYLDTW